MATPAKLHDILHLFVAPITPNVKASVLKPSPGADRKMTTCSLPFRDKPSVLICANHTVSSYISTPWDEIPVALQTVDCSVLFLSFDPQNASEDRWAELLFAFGLLSTLITKHTAKKCDQLCRA